MKKLNIFISGLMIAILFGQTIGVYALNNGDYSSIWSTFTELVKEEYEDEVIYYAEEEYNGEIISYENEKHEYSINVNGNQLEFIDKEYGVCTAGWCPKENVSFIYNYENGILTFDKENSSDGYQKGVMDAVVGALAQMHNFDKENVMKYLEDELTVFYKEDESSCIPAYDTNLTLENNGIEYYAENEEGICGAGTAVETTYFDYIPFDELKFDIANGIKIEGNDVYQLVWDKFIEELSKDEMFENKEGYEQWVMEYTDNSLTIAVDWIKDVKAKFTYSNGVLSMNSYTNQTDEYNYFKEIDGVNAISGDLVMFFDNAASMVIEAYARTMGYNEYKLYSYLADNLNNNWTIENNGIVLNGEWLYSDEELEEMYKDLESACPDGGCGFTNNIIRYDFKLDLINGIKSYEEQTSNKFLDGANQKYDASKDKKLVFRIDIDFSLFDKVYINGKEVDPKYYAVTEGSTVITFTDEYTKTLKNGKYDLEVTFTDGSVAETTFTVANSTANAGTGLYTSVGIVSMLGLIGCALVFTKTRKHSKFPQA